MVYGSDSMTAPRLRAFKGGLLDTQAYNVDYGNDEILPDNPDTFCLPNGTNEECWLAGDIRVNENHGKIWFWAQEAINRTRLPLVLQFNVYLRHKVG